MVFIKTKVKHSVKKLRKNASILLLFSISRQKNASVLLSAVLRWMKYSLHKSQLNQLSVGQCSESMWTNCWLWRCFVLMRNSQSSLYSWNDWIFLAKFCNTAVNVTTGIWTNPKTLLKFSRNSVCTVLAKKLNDALNCDFGYFCSKKSNDFHLLGV